MYLFNKIVLQFYSGNGSPSKHTTTRNDRPMAGHFANAERS
jgi:hypothetical protein